MLRPGLLCGNHSSLLRHSRQGFTVTDALTLPASARALCPAFPYAGSTTWLGATLPSEELGKRLGISTVGHSEGSNSSFTRSPSRGWTQ